MKKENNIKSMFCYRHEKVKKMILSLKYNKSFYSEEDGRNLVELLRSEIDGYISNNIIFIAVPSMSFWQSRKSFDHMHILMRNIMEAEIKNKKSTGYLQNHNNKNMLYIPHAIVPRLNKDVQKKLNKEERQKQTIGAYRLSFNFKYLLKNIIKDKTWHGLDENNQHLTILIIDDVKTTGATLNECIGIVEDFLDKIKDSTIQVRGLTIAYEP